MLGAGREGAGGGGAAAAHLEATSMKATLLGGGEKAKTSEGRVIY